MNTSRLFILLILILLGSSLMGQVNYLPGYIVTIELDTIRGKVDFRSLPKLHSSCQFKNKDLGKKIYSPGEISAFGFNSGQRFESQYLDGELVFIQKLVSGKVDLYYYQKIRPRYFISKNNSPIIELTYSKELVAFDMYGKPNNGKKYVVEEATPKKRKDELIYGDYILANEGFKKF